MRLCLNFYFSTTSTTKEILANNFFVWIEYVRLRGGALSAPVRKSLKELTKTPCCYLEFGPILILRSHAKIQSLISKIERDFEI